MFPRSFIGQKCNIFVTFLLRKSLTGHIDILKISDQLQMRNG